MNIECPFFKDHQHPFVGHSHWPRSENVQQNRCRHCLVDPALCTQQYIMSRPKTGLQTRECRKSKINPASDLLGALNVCKEYRADVLEFVHIPQGLAIKHGSPEMSANITWDFRSVNAHVGYCGVAVRYMDVRTNLNPCEALHGLTKNR